MNALNHPEPEYPSRKSIMLAIIIISASVLIFMEFVKRETELKDKRVDEYNTVQANNETEMDIGNQLAKYKLVAEKNAKADRVIFMTTPLGIEWYVRFETDYGVTISSSSLNKLRMGGETLHKYLGECIYEMKLLHYDFVYMTSNPSGLLFVKHYERE